MNAISEKTYVPLGFLAGLLSVFIGGTWWLSSAYARLANAEENILTLKASNAEVVHQLQTVNETLIAIRTVLDKKR